MVAFGGGIRVWLIGKGIGVEFYSTSKNPRVRAAAQTAIDWAKGVDRWEQTRDLDAGGVLADNRTWQEMLRDSQTPPSSRATIVLDQLRRAEEGGGISKAGYQLLLSAIPNSYPQAAALVERLVNIPLKQD